MKQPTLAQLAELPGRTAVFFSHTIKAQPENMALLDLCLEKNIRLVDYEARPRAGRHTTEEHEIINFF